MAVDQNLIARDLQHVWHPCSQMKDFEQNPPFLVQGAKGSYIYTPQGPVIDAISSWWCKSLGHGHPAVLTAIEQQLKQFEHVMGANTTYPAVIQLAEQLHRLFGNQHVFFASDGSSAVEIALKLALHAQRLKSENSSHPMAHPRFIALKHGYHGETFATLSIGDLGLYKQAYEPFGLSCQFLDEVPYINHTQDPLWLDCTDAWETTQLRLESCKDQLCAIIVEPIVQGAGGMRSYSADYLRRLALWAKENEVYFIADEIMTGLGRTGTWLACDHAHIKPDMICLSKGLTSGSVPLSCVLIDHDIYELFYHDFNPATSFLHSHTYSGHPLGVAAALATLTVMETEGIIEQAQSLGHDLLKCFTQIASQTGKLNHIRSVGAWVAAELQPTGHPRLGFKLAQEALRRGALLRPLGHTLYWLPPLTTDKTTIEQLTEITHDAINAVYTVYD